MDDLWHLQREPDVQLLKRIASRDDLAFSVFYRRHLALVTAYLRRCAEDRETAVDLTAEVFAAVLVAAPRYRDRGPAEAWLLGIARNKLRASRRRGNIDARARRRLGYTRVDFSDPDLVQLEQLADAGEHALTELLDRMPKHERDAVVARVLHERPYHEIAAAINTSELVVRKRVSRGLARLRKGLTNS